VAETNGLLNRRTDNSVPRVRIPPSPPQKRLPFRGPFLWQRQRRFEPVFWFVGVRRRVVRGRSAAETTGAKRRSIPPSPSISFCVSPAHFCLAAVRDTLSKCWWGLMWAFPTKSSPSTCDGEVDRPGVSTGETEGTATSKAPPSVAAIAPPATSILSLVEGQVDGED
jgi:hypothetical protein